MHKTSRLELHSQLRKQLYLILLFLVIGLIANDILSIYIIFWVGRFLGILQLMILLYELTYTYSMKPLHESKSSQIMVGNTNDSNRSHAINIILNHDFSEELHMWHPNCCDGFVVSANSDYPKGISEKSVGNYAVVTNRKECWQGLEQDITARVSPGSTYTVSADVGVSGPLQGSADVLATLKLEYRGTGTSYLFVGR